MIDETITIKKPKKLAISKQEVDLRIQLGDAFVDKLLGEWGDKKKLLKYLNDQYIPQIGEKQIANRIKKMIEKETIKTNKVANVKTEKLTLQSIVTDYNFHKVISGAKMFWMYQNPNKDEYGNREWKSVTKEILKCMFHPLTVYIRGGEGIPDYNALDEFNRLLSEQNRTFHKITQSYSKAVGCNKEELNIMNKEFAKPISDGTTAYHWFFDTVFTSLSGGSDTNTKEHLEKIILAKWQHPENVFLPGIFINDNGATFKDLAVIKLFTPLFGGNVLYNGTIEHLLGKFNSIVAGKALLHISEIERDKVNMNKLKSIMGSPYIIVEAKFEVPYQADNTGLHFVTGNNERGSVTLSGENQDRRYSIFSPPGDGWNLLIEDILKYEGKTITREEADKWIKEIGQHILSNKEQIGKWLNAKIAQYGDITHLLPIKNQAYHNLIEIQRSSWLSYVETVFEEPTFEYIRHELLIELLHKYNKGFNPSTRTSKPEIERLIRDRKYPIIYQNRAVINIDSTRSMQRNVWRRARLADNGGMSSLQQNEDLFGEFDEYGRWNWTWKA